MRPSRTKSASAFDDRGLDARLIACLFLVRPSRTQNLRCFHDRGLRETSVSFFFWSFHHDSQKRVQWHDRGLDAIEDWVRGIVSFGIRPNKGPCWARVFMIEDWLRVMIKLTERIRLYLLEGLPRFMAFRIAWSSTVSLFAFHFSLA